jgi:DNA-binding MarR family transcriptional regulator
MERLCKIRDIYRAIFEFESAFQTRYGIGLNEGMLLCTLSKSEHNSSGEIAACLGLTCSNTSKIIASAEKKGLIQRALGDNDKRQMYFSLTEKGKEQLQSISKFDLEIPELLKAIMDENQ